MVTTESITMSFLPAGHTKFSPDPDFGILKAKFRRSDVNNLTELLKVVVESTPDSNLNQAKLVGDIAGPSSRSMTGSSISGDLSSKIFRTLKASTNLIEYKKGRVRLH